MRDNCYTCASQIFFTDFKAAFRLGVKRSTLLDRMKKLGIDVREIRSSLGEQNQVA
jgi:Transcriptional regulator containing GAF, AAA-type ATPase, and DNA binding domains